jgi:hypothetical protein
LEKQFFKTFSKENSTFPNTFGGGGKFSAEFSPKFSPEKMYKKSAPGVDLILVLVVYVQNVIDINFLFELSILFSQY